MLREPGPPGSLAMPVATLTLQLRIEHARSLKDRRQVVRSLKAKLRQGFNVSVSGLDNAVTWRTAVIGVAGISGSRYYLTGQMQQVEDAAERIATELSAVITDSWCEFVD